MESRLLERKTGRDLRGNLTIDAAADTKCHQCGDVCSYFNWVTCQKGLLDNGERPWNVSNNEYSQVVGYLLTKILATGWL